MGSSGCRKKMSCKIAALCIWMLLSACAAPAVIKSQTPSDAKPDAASASVLAANAVQHRDQSQRQGSLWTDDGFLSEMFVSPKARGVGDIVTIDIVENSSATNNAKTNTGRTTSMSVGLNSLFGLENKFPSGSNFFNPFSSADSTYASKFDGTGSTARSGALTAYITARIIQILPNGNFIIEGNREVRVNNDNQIITLTGTIRPRDISAQNVVKSTYIADARISYSGTGVLNDQQRPGWLARILDNVWPF